MDATQYTSPMCGLRADEYDTTTGALYVNNTYPRAPFYSEFWRRHAQQSASNFSHAAGNGISPVSTMLGNNNTPRYLDPERPMTSDTSGFGPHQHFATNQPGPSQLQRPPFYGPTGAQGYAPEVQATQQSEMSHSGSAYPPVAPAIAPGAMATVNPVETLNHSTHDTAMPAHNPGIADEQMYAQDQGVPSGPAPNTSSTLYTTPAIADQDLLPDMPTLSNQNWTSDRDWTSFQEVANSVPLPAPTNYSTVSADNGTMQCDNSGNQTGFDLSGPASAPPGWYHPVPQELFAGQTPASDMLPTGEAPSVVSQAPPINYYVEPVITDGSASYQLAANQTGFNTSVPPRAPWLNTTAPDTTSGAVTIDLTSDDAGLDNNVPRAQYLETTAPATDGAVSHYEPAVTQPGPGAATAAAPTNSRRRQRSNTTEDEEERPRKRARSSPNGPKVPCSWAGCTYQAPCQRTLTQHTNSVHENKPYKICGVCNVGCKDASSFSKHNISANHQRNVREAQGMTAADAKKAAAKAKKWACRFCTKLGNECAFGRTDQLKRHLLTCKSWPSGEGRLPRHYCNGPGGMAQGRLKKGSTTEFVEVEKPQDRP